jgi:ATP-dependent DNA helicase PIF1
MKQFTDFFMTASTGIAAVQIGGMTLHSFAGTGKGEDGIIQLKKQCARNKRVKKHWKNCKVLIIDEVSMVYFKEFG